MIGIRHKLPWKKNKVCAYDRLNMLLEHSKTVSVPKQAMTLHVWPISGWKRIISISACVTDFSLEDHTNLCMCDPISDWKCKISPTWEFVSKLKVFFSLDRRLTNCGNNTTTLNITYTDWFPCGFYNIRTFLNLWTRLNLIPSTHISLQSACYSNS